MKSGDSPVLFVYPPDDLSDESVHAISEFLYAICRSFDQQYARQLSLIHDAHEGITSKFHCEVAEEDEPF
jgi:hypothetical protein